MRTPASPERTSSAAQMRAAFCKSSMFRVRVPSFSSACAAWMQVRRFDDMTPFADAGNPAEDELIGYEVYRATSPIKAAWELLYSTTPAGQSIGLFTTRSKSGTSSAALANWRCMLAWRSAAARSASRLRMPSSTPH